MKHFNIRLFIKKIFKKNKFMVGVIAELLYIYLRFVYLTSRWQFVFLGSVNKEEFLNMRGCIFAFWHNRLALGLRIFRGHKNIYALVSAHSDGKVISSIVNKF